MKRIAHTAIFFVLWISMIRQVSAQDKTWERPEEGEIEDASFVVEKNRQIVLPQEARKFEKVPPLPAGEDDNMVRAYTYRSILPEIQGLNVRNRALKLKEEPLEKLYGGNISAGFGNYVSPYLDVNVFNKREDRYQIGLTAFHLSSRNGPVDKENSGEGISRLGFDSKIFGKNLVAGFHAMYDRSFYHFYGYPEGTEVNEDDIRQIFNRVGAGIHLENKDKRDDFNYRIGLNFNRISDSFASSESDFLLQITTSLYLTENLDFFTDGSAGLDSYNYKNPINRNLIKVKPGIKYKTDDYEIKAGLNFAFQNDTLSTRGEVVLYPVAGVDYFISDYFMMFLSLDGDMERVNYFRLTSENPYLQSGEPVFFANRQFGLKWGLKGNVSNWLNMAAGVTFSSYKDLYFFQNDSMDISRFNILYDHENTSVTDIYGELVFSRVKNYHVSFRGDYFNYATQQLSEAWMRPSYKLNVDFQYNLYDKVYLGSSVSILGGIKSYDWINNETIMLDPFVDLDLDIQYFLSPRLSGFLRFSNLLGKNYERYWRYPSRSIQGMFGFSYSF